MINTVKDIWVLFVRKSRNRKRTNRYTKHKNQYDRPNKLWDYSSRQTANGQYSVNFLAPIHRCSNATQNTDRRNQNQCDNRQLRRLTCCGPQDFRDWLFILQRNAQIACYHATHPPAVLHDEWLIKTFFFIPNFVGFRRCISTKSLFGDIPGQD